LSAFAPNDDEALIPSVVAAHLLPLFEFAAEIIPSEFHNNTSVKYQATAGMRLLSDEQQLQVYDALYRGLMESETFVFRCTKRGDIGTLTGDMEGFYGAVAANYLSGVIDANLHLVNTNNKQGETSNQHGEITSTTHPIGALDMGGSSTQIVYLTEQIDNGSHSCSLPKPEAPQGGEGAQNYAYNNDEVEDDEDYPQACRLAGYNGGKTRLQGENFFSTSYLSYGVDQFRERLWNTLIMERHMEDHTNSCDTKIILYPCGFKGHVIEWNDYTFIGTGDADECGRQIQRLLSHPEESIDNHHEHIGRKVGGVDHPPVRGKFFAMSLYFFALDSLRVLSAHDALNLSWPRPSIEELSDALDGLCSRSWKGDLEEIQHQAHQFTRAEVLPHRCFESVYMVTLLRDGFGFHPQSRDITFTFLVDGSEVEWSLGMALALSSDPGKQGVAANCRSSFTPSATGSNNTQDCKPDVPNPIITSSFSAVSTCSG